MGELITATVMGLLGTSFIFAYIYRHINEDRQWLKFLFLSMSFLSLLVLIWTMFTAEQTQTIQNYDDMGTFIGNQTLHAELDSPIKNVLIKWWYIIFWVLIIFLLGALGFQALQSYKLVVNKKHKQEGYT